MGGCTRVSSTYRSMGAWLVFGEGERSSSHHASLMDGGGRSIPWERNIVCIIRGRREGVRRVGVGVLRLAH